MEINPVKGTHDIFGDESSEYIYVENRCRYVAEVYSYREIRTPIIEHTPLFLRSVGEGSDIVSKEMYTFDDKGGRSITLRPEMTAGVMRSIVTNKLYANADLPLRYYYVGPCFRYERPQAGRYRQFHQFGIEAVGAPSYRLDAEAVSIGHRILYSLGIRNVKVFINSLGDDESRANYKAALKEYFSKHIENMCPDCKRRLEVNPLRILDCKVPEDIEIVKGAPKLADYLSEASKTYLNTVISVLKELNIEVEIDDKLVRGLDYYTGVVWEYHVEKTEGITAVGALGGGGHYAKLLHEVGGPDLEGVGLSLGLERVVSVLKEMGLAADHDGVDIFVMSMNEEIIDANVLLCDILRSEGFSVMTNYEVKSFKSLFKLADKLKTKFAIIVGEDELANGKIQIKNMATQEQTEVSLEDAPRVIHDLMGELISEDK